MFERNSSTVRKLIFFILSILLVTTEGKNSRLYSSNKSVSNTSRPSFKVQIPQRVTYGDTVSILGRYLPSTKLIDISFTSHADSKDIALLISLKMDDQVVVRNSYVNGKWGKEETYGGFPLTDDGMFDMTVYFFDDFYHIVIGADHFCRFPVRVPLSHTNFMVVVGLSDVEKVAWDIGCKC